MYMDVHLKWFHMHEILCAKNYNLGRPGNIVVMKNNLNSPNIDSCFKLKKQIGILRLLEEH